MMSANQIAGFFKMQYLQKEVNDEVYFWHTDKHRSLLQVDTINLGLCNQACPKYPKEKVCISLQYLQKSMEDEVDFLPADNHESFLQMDSIAWGVCIQTCPKYQKQQVYKIFAI